MYQYKGLEDTIAAIATPAGQGAIGIVRLSGQQAFQIAQAIVRLKGLLTLAECKSHTVHYGKVLDAPNGAVVDEVLVTVMRSPNSYTAEDTVEISGHGGMTVLTAILQALLNAGARLAEPGEFTKRAYLNGRMDLTQAEAVIDIIQAKTGQFLRQSQHQLEGALSLRLKAIREELLRLYTAAEALINFPEDGIESQGRQDLGQGLGLQQQAVAELLESSRGGRILKEGMRIVLCGKPNVGKSSLWNALLKEQRAIVTPIAGTTRDVLEEQAQLSGIPLALVDTAGILEPRDLIEQEAVARSRLFIKGADLALLVLDHSRPLEAQDTLLMEQLKSSKVLAVVNKMDLPLKLDMTAAEKIFGFKQVIKVSALDPASIAQLEGKIIEMIRMDKDLETDGLWLSNIRHIKALEEARENLSGALRLMQEGASLEFICEEIKAAVNQLDAITGRNIDEDLLERIFSEFCIGK